MKMRTRYRPEQVMRHILEQVDAGNVSLPIAKDCAESIATAQLLGWKLLPVNWRKQS